MKKKSKNSFKKLFYLLFMGFFLWSSITNTFAQGLANTCWKNAFGSNARITSHDLSTGEFRGTYGSTTGSAGYYTVIGQTPPNLNINDSFPLTFTIGWGKINGTPDDPSQYWTSTMSGYYNGISSELNLLNIISAPGSFEAVKILEPGNLPQTQSFTLVAIGDCDTINVPAPSIPSGDGSSIDQEYAYQLLGNWNLNFNYGTGEVSQMVLENLVPRGENFTTLRYYEVTGALYVEDDEKPISFIGIVSPHILLDTNFAFAISIVGTSIDSENEFYNLSLSGYSDGNGIKMFLTKSYSNYLHGSINNRVSSSELFQKN